MGVFKHYSYLDYSLQQYQKIIHKKEKMYLPIFDTMTIEEIHKYVWFLDFSKDEDEAKYDELSDRGIYIYFGDQFGFTQSDGMVLNKNEFLHFIWRNDFGEPVLDARIEFQYFSKVFEEYIQYCRMNDLFNS